MSGGRANFVPGGASAITGISAVKSGAWEFIQYEEQHHYTYLRDPHNGTLLRKYSHTTREERGKLVVEFEDEVVTAIEESENRGAAKVRIIVPPIVFAW